MDQLRIWTARLLAPLAFLAAATLLVVVVQRALEGDSGSSAPVQQTLPIGSVPLTTEPSEPDTGTVTVAKEYYRVKPGDTLEAIAGKFDTSVERLLALNPGVDPLALSPGQRVRVA
jgi:LysM repeat protein